MSKMIVEKNSQGISWGSFLLVPLAVLLFFLAVLLNKPSNVKRYPALSEDFDKTSQGIIKVLNSQQVNSSITPNAFPLGTSLKNFDNAYEKKDWALAYNMRATRWKNLVGLEVWENILKRKDCEIESLFILNASAFPNPTPPASTFLINKAALLRSKTNLSTHYEFYSEVWMLEQGQWVSLGGAEWDEPSLPVLRLENIWGNQ